MNMECGFLNGWIKKKWSQMQCLFVGCLTSQQHASVSQRRSQISPKMVNLRDVAGNAEEEEKEEEEEIAVVNVWIPAL